MDFLSLPANCRQSFARNDFVKHSPWLCETDSNPGPVLEVSSSNMSDSGRFRLLNNPQDKLFSRRMYEWIWKRFICTVNILFEFLQIKLSPGKMLANMDGKCHWISYCRFALRHIGVVSANTKKTLSGHFAATLRNPFNFSTYLRPVTVKFPHVRVIAMPSVDK